MFALFSAKHQRLPLSECAVSNQPVSTPQEPRIELQTHDYVQTATRYLQTPSLGKEDQAQLPICKEILEIDHKSIKAQSDLSLSADFKIWPFTDVAVQGPNVNVSLFIGMADTSRMFSKPG